MKKVIKNKLNNYSFNIWIILLIYFFYAWLTFAGFMLSGIFSGGWGYEFFYVATFASVPIGIFTPVLLISAIILQLMKIPKIKIEKKRFWILISIILFLQLFLIIFNINGTSEGREGYNFIQEILAGHDFKNYLISQPIFSENIIIDGYLFFLLLQIILIYHLTFSTLIRA